MVIGISGGGWKEKMGTPPLIIGGWDGGGISGDPPLNYRGLGMGGRE